MKKFKNYFITGLISIIPIFLTVFILIQLTKQTLKLFSKLFSIQKIRDFVIEAFNIENKLFTNIIVSIIIYGVTFIIIYMIIMLIGFWVVKFIDKEKVKYFENIFLKIPLAKPIYTTIKQIREIIFSQNDKAYKKVLLIEYPRKGIYSIAFLTNENSNYLKKMDLGKNLVSVFVPTSPNPTSGMFLILPKEDTKELKIKIEDAIKMIISGGAIMPDDFRKNDKKEITVDENDE